MKKFFLAVLSVCLGCVSYAGGLEVISFSIPAVTTSVATVTNTVAKKTGQGYVYGVSVTNTASATSQVVVTLSDHGVNTVIYSNAAQNVSGTYFGRYPASVLGTTNTMLDSGTTNVLFPFDDATVTAKSIRASSNYNGVVVNLYLLDQ